MKRFASKVAKGGGAFEMGFKRDTLRGSLWHVEIAERRNDDDEDRSGVDQADHRVSFRLGDTRTRTL